MRSTRVILVVLLAVAWPSAQAADAPRVDIPAAMLADGGAVYHLAVGTSDHLGLSACAGPDTAGRIGLAFLLFHPGDLVLWGFPGIPSREMRPFLEVHSVHDGRETTPLHVEVMAPGVAVDVGEFGGRQFGSVCAYVGIFGPIPEEVVLVVARTPATTDARVTVGGDAPRADVLWSAPGAASGFLTTADLNGPRVALATDEWPGDTGGARVGGALAFETTLGAYATATWSPFAAHAGVLTVETPRGQVLASCSPMPCAHPIAAWSPDLFAGPAGRYDVRLAANAGPETARGITGAWLDAPLPPGLLMTRP